MSAKALSQLHKKINRRWGYFFDKIFIHGKSCSLAYKNLVEKKSETPNVSQQKWLEDAIIITDNDIDWGAAFFNYLFTVLKAQNL